MSIEVANEGEGRYILRPGVSSMQELVACWDPYPKRRKIEGRPYGTA